MSYESKIIYGPVLSRRLGEFNGKKLVHLGKSLGVDLSPFPQKICSFDCIYCSFGDTKIKTLKPPIIYFLNYLKEEIEKGLKQKVERKTPIKYISFVGQTEPTISQYFPEIVDIFFELKQKYFPKKPTAIFTNSSTLNNKKVKEALLKFDRTFFKLDAGDEETFQKINKPIKELDLEQIIRLLEEFSYQTGKVELSSMVLKTNYKSLTSKKFLQIAEKIRPKNNIFYLCTPDWYRPIKKGRYIKFIDITTSKEIVEFVSDFIEKNSTMMPIILPPKRRGRHPHYSEIHKNEI